MRNAGILVLGLGIITPPHLTSQEFPRPVTRSLEFRLADASAPLRGELLAAERDSLWILPHSGPVRTLALAAVSEVRGQHSGMTSRGILVWATFGGLASGVALTAACATVEDASCGAVLPVTLGLWWLVGGLAAAVTGPGRFTLPRAAEALRPYARFPQGLPVNFPLGDPRSPVQERETGARDMDSTAISWQFPAAVRMR